MTIIDRRVSSGSDVECRMAPKYLPESQHRCAFVGPDSANTQMAFIEDRRFAKVNANDSRRLQDSLLITRLA